MEYKLIYTDGSNEITEIYNSFDEYISGLEDLQKKINVPNSTYYWIDGISGSIE